MRVRVVLAVAMAVVAALGLTSCSGSNVGLAASYDGKQISQTKLASFVTPQSQGVQLQQGQPPTPPKSFALLIVIREQLWYELLRHTKGGAPSPGQVSALINQEVGNGTPHQAVTALGVKGYTTAFDQEVLRYRALGTLLSSRARAGVNLDSVIKTIHFPVSVNPRYGQWVRKTISIDAGRNAGVPGFVNLQPGSLSALSG